MKQRFSRTVIAVLAVFIGLYPFLYLFLNEKFGLLSTKTESLLSDITWRICFYAHIFSGGLTLIIGWTQFNDSWRKAKTFIHRTVGKIYIVGVWISSITGLYVACYATGGIISATGFMSLAIIWIVTTTLAYTNVKEKNFIKHRQWMIYSYACCFAAVTLRLWLPFLSAISGDFISAYRVVAWLSWVPNLAVAFYIQRKSS